jgi:hypothetical protein
MTVGGRPLDPVQAKSDRADVSGYGIPYIGETLWLNIRLI